jgi:hypothetical protein
MDIVERLRLVVGDLPPKGHVPLAQETADEIERLREELKYVRQWIDCESWLWNRHEPVIARIDAVLAK